MGIYTHLCSVQINKNKKMGLTVKKTNLEISKKMGFALVLFFTSAFTLSGQYFQDFDNVQFFGTGNTNASQDLAYNEGWSRSSSHVFLVNNGTNGFMRIRRNNYFSTNFYSFNSNDTIEFGYRITNNSGGARATRNLNIYLVDASNNETLVYTSPNISRASSAYSSVEFVVSTTGIYNIMFEYTSTRGNNSHYLELDDFYTSGSMHILPVSLTSFESKLEKSDAIITWSTASEHNADIFEVEVSEDGHYFQSIGTLSATGSAYQAAEYQFTHYNAFAISQSKVLYYRLKMVDMDGSFTYSPLTEVMKSNDRVENKVTYNNPFGATLNIQVQDAGSIDKIVLRDMQGKERITESVHSHNTALNTSSLQIGIYYMTIYFNNGEVSTQKLIKN